MKYELTGLNRSFSPFESLFNVGLERDIERSFKPSVDIHEEAEQWTVSVDLPGETKEDIKVDVVNGQLVISGERQSERTEKGYSERRFGRFERRFTLPERIDATKISASYAHGVLHLTVPKEEKAKPISIAIDVKTDENLKN